MARAGRRGRSAVQVPSKIANAPRLTMGLELFWNAYWLLCSDRSPDTVRSEGNRRYATIHFIPWASVQAYAAAHALGAEQTDALHHHIRAMDIAYRAAKGHTAGQSTEQVEVDGNPKRVRQAHPRDR